MPTRQNSSGMLRRILTGLDREEQGYPPDRTNSTMESNTKVLTVETTDATALVPPEDKLLTFRSLTGIDTVPALTASGHSARTAPNIGIYTRVVRAEKKAASSHSRFSILINVCLGLQVVVAASLTALGAAKGSHKAITAFGAINTIVAGILTYLKGSGLPGKYKFHEEEWKRLREHIEQREREFCLANCNLDVQEEIYIVEDMYQRVKARLEGSHSSPGPQSEGPGPRHEDRAHKTLSTLPSARFTMRHSEVLPPISPISPSRHDKLPSTGIEKM
ncbi:hypothetical protein BGZ63DRAFT_372944 [Mariannaea sp. PMI_226]|nr:hypothetical protein BGZ63DRAFT_372944 [Mariannaea sp. PMI_226]